MSDILLRNLLVPSSLAEWPIFNRTLIKAPHLPHESAGNGAPPLFSPMLLPVPCLLCPRLVEVGKLEISLGKRQPEGARYSVCWGSLIRRVWWSLLGLEPEDRRSR